MPPRTCDRTPSPVRRSPAIPEINGARVKNVQQLMREYTDVLPVWIM